MYRWQVLILLVIVAACHPSSGDVLTLQSFGDSLQPNREFYPLRFSVGLQDIEQSLIKQGEALKIVIQTESQESPNGNCKFTATYPVVEGLRNTTLQAELNQSLRRSILEKPDQYFQTLLQDEYCTTAPGTTWVWHISMRGCTVKFAKQSLISITCNETIERMGPYPNNWDRTATFDLETGKIYSFSDLFKSNSNYPQRVSHLMLADYSERGGNSKDPEGESLTARGTEETFYLASQCEYREAISIEHTLLYSDDSTCIILPNIFSSGPRRNITFEMSVDEIKDILSFEGALQALLDSPD